MDRIVDVMVALAQAGIPTDVQELLVRGDPMRGIAPGAIAKALAARRMDREELAKAITKSLYKAEFHEMTSWVQRDMRDAADAVITYLNGVEQGSPERDQ